MLAVNLSLAVMPRRRAQSSAVATLNPQPTRMINALTNDPARGLCEPISHRGLRWFRALFLLALAYDSRCVATRGEMADFFGRPAGLNFVYPAAPWVRPLSAPLMELMPHAIFSAALASLAFPRCGLAAVTSLQAFLFLCDAARYVNHHYLYVLLSALLLLVAIDTPRGAECRRWHLQLLRLQLCAVYFFGGLVKCSREFLIEGEPLRTPSLVQTRIPTRPPALTPALTQP